MESGKLPWTTILEIVGIFSIVGSLIFVGLQMKQDREISAGENTLLVIAERQVWAELMAENGSIWIKGNSGADLTAEESLTYGTLAEVHELVYFSGWFRNQRVPGGNPPETFAYEWAERCSESPGLMQFWRDSSGRQARKYEQLGLEGEPANLWRQTVNAYIEELAQDD